MNKGGAFVTNIQNELNNIKTALYGKDVRNSIHDAIKTCYDDASVNNDNANMLEYSNIYNSIIDQQRRVENDITLMENENYLSLFQIDRKDIMKIDM